MNDRKALTIGIVLGAILLLCFCCLAALGGGAYLLKEWASTLETYDPTNYAITGDPTSTPHPLATWERSDEGLQTAGEMLTMLEEMTVPENDPVELAMRLGEVAFVPETAPDPDAPYQLGAHKVFWVSDTATDENFQVDMVLRFISDHIYFWIEDGVRYDENDLQEMGSTFENEIYPTTRSFFGSEWSPGIDEDAHIYILYASGIGYGTAGYFSSTDSVHPLAAEYSNAHETFVFNADNSPLNDESTYGTLAHEFQHMIHWYRDRNETTWLNEGFSELSSLLNGYDPGGFDLYYVSNPDMQLTDWPSDDSSTYPHYGASFLFATYFLDRMGAEATQKLVAHPANSLHSIDLLLQELDAHDPLTNQPLTANDLVLDWTLTNYLQDERISDGRYAYTSYAFAPRAYETETMYDCVQGVQPRTVMQYGVDYIRIACPGTHTLHFDGAQKTTLLPADAHSGEYSFWSNKGDESDMTLTRLFDFSQVSGPLTLSYWTWYDIEEDWDYVFLTASVDNEHWQILTTPSSTDYNPQGNNFGWGYTGLSGGGPEWIEEEVDISQFAGQKVWLRFEYVTDASVHNEGLLIDDIAVPETGYFTDFESDQGGWEGAGFVRVANLLPQTFRLALVSVGSETTVEYLSLDENNSLDIPLEIGNGVSEVTLVVLGTTRFTRQPASYQFEFLP